MNAPTAQSITRSITDPETCCRNSAVCGTTAGLGSGIFLGAKVTGCTPAQAINCFFNSGTVADCQKCFAATYLCTSISVGMAIVGGLTLGITGCMCAKQMQRSSCLANYDSVEANKTSDQEDPPARDITGTKDQKIADQKTTAPVTGPEVI